jgi:hypothetical protein
MSSSDDHEKSVEPSLEPLLQAHIGKQLRDMFSAMTREPVPEKFRLLLDRLEAGEALDSSGQTSGAPCETRDGTEADGAESR